MRHAYNIYVCEEKASGWRLKPFLVHGPFQFFENGGDRHSTGYVRCQTARGGYQFPPKSSDKNNICRLWLYGCSLVEVARFLFNLSMVF